MNGAAEAKKRKKERREKEIFLRKEKNKIPCGCRFSLRVL